VSRRSVFGWHYPAGAENDPNAPWNQPDESEMDECECGNMKHEEASYCDECHEADAGEAAYEAMMDARMEADWY